MVRRKGRADVIVRIPAAEDALSHAVTRLPRPGWTTLCASRKGDGLDLAFLAQDALEPVLGPPTCLWCVARRG